MTNTSINFLARELINRREKNPRYSERAFAKTLGLSPGFLKLVFQGKRALSLNTAMEVARRLGWSERETRDFLLQISTEKSKIDDPLIVSSTSVDKFSEISDWYHFTIIELIKTKKTNWSAEKISKKLNLSKIDVEFSLRLLIRHGLIIETDSGFVAVENYIVPALSSSAIRKFHRQMLERAANSVEEQDVSKRELRSLTLAFDSSRMDEARAMIKEFSQKFEKRFSAGKRNRVYQLSMAFFGLDNEGDVK